MNDNGNACLSFDWANRATRNGIINEPANIPGRLVRVASLVWMVRPSFGSDYCPA